MTDEQKNADVLVRELIRLQEKRYNVCVSDFLNEGQQAYAAKELEQQGCRCHMFFGGFENAERRVLAVYPEYIIPQNDDFGITELHIRYRKNAEISHRDILGALMGLGIRREKIGDIVVQSGRATFFIKTELAQYVSSQLEKVGREGVEFSEIGADLTAAAPKLLTRGVTASSLRLDVLVGECANLSRSKAQAAVRGGLVYVNSLPVDKCDVKLSSGDKISVRGSGKFIVEFDGELSKKGKYKITISKYL